MQNQTVLGHPKGLFYLFFTEMWERFSYYGMRALLVLYMTQYLLVDPERAHRVLGYDALERFLVATFGTLSTQAMSSQIYGLYTGFVYFTPFFGGLVADRILGQRRSVYLGGVLMAIGHFLMAFETFFFPALLFLIVGNGFFKPNISTQVGSLYSETDPRRDRAYMIFYMGVNLGAFFSPLVCGTLGQTMGWHWGFGAAGVGMLIGLVVYSLGQKHLAEDDLTRRSKTPNAKEEKITSDDWKRIFALIFLCIINILFWAVYEQQGNTLQLWADQNVDWSLGSLMIPSTWFQSFNPFLIFVLTPPLAMFWAWQNKKGWEPKTLAKMMIGCFFAGAAYLFMILIIRVVGEHNKGHFLWLLGTVFLFTVGELYLSPIGLSLVTKISPPKMVSMLMGVWYLSNFFGNYLSGYIGSFYETMGQESFFKLLAVLSAVAGLLFLASLKPMRKIIKS